MSSIRRSRIPAVVAATCTIAAGLTLGMPAAHAVTDTEWQYDDPGHYTWTVPAGVHLIDVELWGAYGGGASPGTSGGAPAYVEGFLTVTPGSTYHIFVGGTGDDRSAVDGAPHGGGYNGGGDGGAKGVNGSGGGGGGATDMRYDEDAMFDRVAVAAGGGGSSSSWGGTAFDEYGDPGDDYGEVMGGAGAEVDRDGAGAQGVGDFAGLGSGITGSMGQGGAGQYNEHCRYTGGGGGAGYYSGGGGGCEDNSGGSGGGAGSSLVPDEGYVSDTSGNPDDDEDGYAVITLLDPEPPTSVDAVAGDASATVSWTAPEFTGSMDIIEYTVRAFPGLAQCTTNGATSCVVTGLENGTEYSFLVEARTGVGSSDPSDPSGTVTPQPSSTVAPTVAFPRAGAFLSTWTVLRSFGTPAATMSSSTPKICRVSGARVAFLRTAGTCRLTVRQEGQPVARGSIAVAASGSGTPMTTKLIRFRDGSTYLTRASQRRLATWAPELIDHESVVAVRGWVSGMRNTKAARTLSAKRAQVVATYLRSLGVTVTARYGAGAHWLGSSARSRAAEVSWYAAPLD
jgi:outer membrane protein OmpA-like peptidoglycan-associated protein